MQSTKNSFWNIVDTLLLGAYGALGISFLYLLHGDFSGRFEEVSLPITYSLSQGYSRLLAVTTGTISFFGLVVITSFVGYRRRKTYWAVALNLIFYEIVVGTSIVLGPSFSSFHLVIFPSVTAFIIAVWTLLSLESLGTDLKKMNFEVLKIAFDKEMKYLELTANTTFLTLAGILVVTAVGWYGNLSPTQLGSTLLAELLAYASAYLGILLFGPLYLVGKRRLMAERIFDRIRVVKSSSS